MAVSLFSFKKTPTSKVTSFVDPTKFGGAFSGAKRPSLRSEAVEKATAIKEVKELNYIRRALETLVSLEKRHFDMVGDSIKKFVLSEEKRQAKEEETSQESKKDKDKKKDETKNPLVKEGKRRLEGVGMFFQSLMKLFIGYKILEWAGKPENAKKIQNIINFFSRLFKFIGVIGKGIALAFGATPIGIVLNSLPKAFDLVMKVIGGIIDFISFKWLGESIQAVGKLISDSINVLKSIPNAIGSLVSFITNLIPNFIESVLTQGLNGTKDQLESEVNSPTVEPAKAEVAPSGGEESKPEGIDFGKMFGDSLKNVASTVLQNVIPGGNLIASVGNGISGVFGKKDEELPKLAKGGIVTKPTEAIVGEAGPEAILPLDKLGSFGVEQFKGQVDKQIPSFIKLLTLPFKIVGAGIIALISSSVSRIPGIGPILMPLISNVASMFGIPPSLVKGMSNFASAAIKSVGDGMSAVKEVFGIEEPNITKSKADEFKPSGDTSVRGLLGDILSALISKNSKSSTTEPTTTPSTPSAPSAGAPSGGAGGPGAGAGTATAADMAKESIKKAGGLREDGTLKGVQGTVRDMGRAGKEYSPGGGLKEVINGGKKYWYDATGNVFKWEKPGDPLTDITSTKLFDSKTLGGPLVRVPNTGEVKILKGSFGGDQTAEGMYNYEMGKVLKSRATKGPKGGKGKDVWEPPTDGIYGRPAKFLGGGGVGGSGVGDKIPALLEPEEYVLNRNAASKLGGPKVLDKINFDMFPRFGNDIGRLYDNDKLVTRTYAEGGIVAAAKDAVNKGKRGPASPPCASWVRMVLGLAGNPFANKVTQKGDLDPEKKPWGPNMAASFAGSDMGEVIGSQGNLQPGDIVLHRNTYGSYPAGAVTHVSIASEKKGKIYHQPTSGAPPTEGGIWNFKAGIRLGGSGGGLSSGASGGAGGSSDTSTPDWTSIAPQLTKLTEMLVGPKSTEKEQSDKPLQPPPKISSLPSSRSQSLQTAQRENNTLQSQRRTSAGAGPNVVTMPMQPKTISETTSKPLPQPLGGTTPPIPLSTYPLAP